MKAYIYTGGKIDPSNITETPTADDIVIAADSGYENAKTLGIKPSVLLGDFDSLDISRVDGSSAEIISVPAEKDFTDTQMAIDVALKKGASEIFIIGGLSGRLDHTLSNLAILEDLSKKKIRAIINDGYNRARYIESDSIIIFKSDYKYLSLIAKGEKVKGVCVEGCKYELKNATLTDKYQYTISNEILKNCAFISVKKGSLFIIESRDAN